MQSTLSHSLSPGNPPAKLRPRPNLTGMPRPNRAPGQATSNAWAERTPETAELMAKVVELRRQRMHYRDIGAALGISVGYAHKLYDMALNDIPARHVDEHRAEELVLIDDAVADLIKIATDEKISHRSRIEAWSTIRAWAERKAKLLGLDAPTQTVSIDKIDAEIMALSREIDALAAAGEDDVPVEAP